MEFTGDIDQVLRRVLEKGILALDWEEFKELAAMLFQEELLYKVEFTPPTDDQGIDLKLYAIGGDLHVAQCKHWKSEVGSPVVRDFYGAMLHFKASKGFLVVCAGVSKSAQEFIAGKPIEVMNLNKILNFLFLVQTRLGYKVGYKRGYQEGVSSKITLP